MENLYFYDFEDFACDIADKYESIRDDDYNDIAIVAKYEEVKQIIKELLCIGYDLHSIEMQDAEWDGYDSEYIVSLYDNEIWCEPMLRESGYITDDSPFMYVLDNCSSKVIPYCQGKAVYEVSIGDTESDNDENYTINGISATKEEFDEYVSQFRKTDNREKTSNELSSTSTATYRVNGKQVDKETYDKAIRELEDKYLDNMRDMLLNYSNWMDRTNELLKLLYW